MGNKERLQRLAQLAETVVHLPVDQQFQTLFKAGLTLADTNWENWQTNPGQETVIPVQPKHTEQLA